MNARCGAFVLALAVLTLGFTAPVSADPLPGEAIKFRQLPLNNGGLPALFPAVTPLPVGVPYPGHDEISTAYLQTGTTHYSGHFMADDFADKLDTPVVHVRWWGSYKNPLTAAGNVKQFLITFENDVPANPNNPIPNSHPGPIQFNQIVSAGALAPGSGTFTEKILPTPAGVVAPTEPLFEYNAELNLGKEFIEHHDTVYWLKIVALVDPQRDGQIQWGWHDRDWSIPDPYASMAVSPGEGTVGGVVIPGAAPVTIPVWHFQDDAVTGDVNFNIDPAMPIMPQQILQDGYAPQKYILPSDGPDGIQQFSKDLAFELYTRVPEPASLLLIGLGGLALAALRRRADRCKR